MSSTNPAMASSLVRRRLGQPVARDALAGLFYLFGCGGRRRRDPLRQASSAACIRRGTGT
jgi:hypothetical protein